MGEQNIVDQFGSPLSEVIPLDVQNRRKVYEWAELNISSADKFGRFWSRRDRILRINLDSTRHLIVEEKVPLTEEERSKVPGRGAFWKELENIPYDQLQFLNGAPMLESFPSSEVLGKKAPRRRSTKQIK